MARTALGTQGNPGRFRVHNWPKYQHYRHRKPPWIKLHHSLLDNLGWHRLQLASRALAPCLWLLASETDDGTLPDVDVIAFRLRETPEVVSEALQDLCNHGFIGGRRLPSNLLWLPLCPNFPGPFVIRLKAKHKAGQKTQGDESWKQE